MTSIPAWISNDFLQTYLEYTEHTEPPKLMHIWSALAGISACMGRHLWLETGIGELYPNMYVLLVGPPGVRKSTSINNMKKLLEKQTGVKFAPEDTSGQRQGLIAAIQDGDNDEIDDMDLDILSAASAIDQITNLGKAEITCNPADRHVMFICASEFGSFMGQNNLDMTRFLIKMWDGEAYDYRLKNSRISLENGLLSMIGGTTPTEISQLLPPEVIGQGFMSRIILVYAPEKHKKIPPSQAFLDKTKRAELEDIYSYVSNVMKGPMQFTAGAQRLNDQLYMRDVNLNDTRFIYYTERRATHLMKLACCLAASRKSMEIDESDVTQADIILAHTEEGMPEALGEFGLSPLATAKQKMVEFIQHAKGPVTDRVLWMVLQRDMKLIDYRNSISDLINAGKIVKVDTKVGAAFVYNDSAQLAIDLLAEDDVADVFDIAEEQG